MKNKPRTKEFLRLRLVFFQEPILLLAVALLLFIALLIPLIGSKLLNGFSVISLSAVTVLAGLQVVYYHAIIVDEIGLGEILFPFSCFLPSLSLPQ